MPKVVLTPKIEAYVKANYLKQSGISMARKFGVSKIVIQRCLKINNLIVTNELKEKFRMEAFLKATKGKTNFTKKEDAFIRENYLDIPVKTMAYMIGRSGQGVNTALKRMGLVIPQKLADERKKLGMFKRGSIPVNKGMKQTDYMTPEAIEKTKASRFKKGDMPHNAKRFKKGDIKIEKDSRGVLYKSICLKVGKWEMLQNFNWKQKYGPIPKGYFLRCLTTETTNCNTNNWELVNRVDHMEKNTIQRFPKELKQTIRLIAKVNKTLKKQ